MKHLRSEEYHFEKGLVDPGRIPLYQQSVAVLRANWYSKGKVKARLRAGGKFLIGRYFLYVPYGHNGSGKDLWLQV